MDAMFVGVGAVGLLGGAWYWIRRSRERGLARDATAGYIVGDYIAATSFPAHDAGYHGRSDCGDAGAGGAGMGSLDSVTVGNLSRLQCRRVETSDEARSRLV